MARKIRKQVTSAKGKPFPSRVTKTLQELSIAQESADALVSLFDRYWSMRLYRETMPAPKEIAAHIEKTRRAIANLQDCLELMPDVIAAYASEYTLQIIGRGYEEYRDDLSSELHRANAVQRAALGRFQNQGPMDSGEKSKQLEAWVLSEIDAVLAPQLNTTRKRACEVAGRIAFDMGVLGVPHNEDGSINGKAVSDKIRRYRKSVETRPSE